MKSSTCQAKFTGRLTNRMHNSLFSRTRASDPGLHADYYDASAFKRESPGKWSGEVFSEQWPLFSSPTQTINRVPECIWTQRSHNHNSFHCSQRCYLEGELLSSLAQHKSLQNCSTEIFDSKMVTLNFRLSPLLHLDVGRPETWHLKSCRESNAKCLCVLAAKHYMPLHVIKVAVANISHAYWTRP